MNTAIPASCRINRFLRLLSRSKSFPCSCSYNRPFETVKRFQSSNGNNHDDKKSDGEEKRRRLFLSLGVLASSLVALAVLKKFPQNQHGDGSDDDDQNGRWVTWKDFVNEMLSTGEIKRLVVAPEYKVVFIELHPGAIVKGRQVTSSTGVLPKYYKLKISSVEAFENNLRKAEEDLGIPPGQGVLVHYARGGVGQLISYVFLGILIYTLFKLFKAKTGTGPSSMFTGIMDNFRKANYRLVDPSFQVKHNLKIKFADVVGLREAKMEIEEFVEYLKVPEKYTNLGAKLPKGALLLGPPGCGKTLLAKAVASEAKVPFLATNGTEFIEMIGGLGAARVRDLFKEASRRAPCMIYIDEIDAIGRRRSGESSNMGNSEQEQTLNQLLVEMDGMDSAKGVIVLASTNRADVLDKALLRRGRFDRHIDIDLPTLVERHELFDYYLRKIKLDQPIHKFSATFAKLTPGFSGADVNNVCNEAAIRAATAGKNCITEQDLHQALDRIVSGPEKRSTTVSPEERQVVAYHECGHALVGWLLKHTNALLKVTIVPRTSTALGFAQYQPQDRKLYSKEELLDRMCMTLGGRAAEILVFNRPTTGAQDDLKKVTKLAYDQVKFYGMSRVLGPLSFAPSPHNQQTPQYMVDKPYSQNLGRLIDDEASRIVTEAYKKAEEILKKNRQKLDLLATTLLQKETIHYQDMVNLIGLPPHGQKKNYRKCRSRIAKSYF